MKGAGWMQEPSNDCHVQRGFEDLANAIVLQAAEDYREAVRIERKYAAKPKDKPCYSPYLRKASTAGRVVECARDEQKDVEQFFASSWCKTLTTVNGALIVQKLREEAHKMYKRKHPHRGKQDGGLT